jgi:hypothetical protein
MRHGASTGYRARRGGAAAYRRALALVGNDVARDYLARRLAEVSTVRPPR